MSLLRKATKNVVKAVKKAFTSDISEQARKQYTTGTKNGGNSRVVESVKEWVNSVEPQNNSVRPSYSVSSYKNASQDVKSFYNQQNNNLVNSVKNHMMGTNRTATNNLRRKQNAQVNKAINAGANAFYSFNNGSQFGGTAQSSLATIDTYKPKTMVELAAAAALRDTTNDRTIQEFQSRHTLDQGLHNNIIGWGQYTLSDQDAVTNWILEGKDDEEKQHRIEEVEEYMKRCFHEVPTYDPATGKYSTSSQIKLDAELPPWIIRNATALDWWDYYKTYSHDVVKSTSDAFRKARDEGRIQARTPYKSAFSTSEEPGAVNSFLDVLIDGIDTNSLSNTYENILQGSIKYVKEYTINPIKVGRLDTAAGNALYNMMETMDIASLGVRAFTAGALALGGRGKLNYVKDDRLINTGNTFLNDDLRVEKHRYYKRDNDAKFKGQNVYWAKIEGHITKDHQADEASKNAQHLFMDKGGYELLMMDNPNYASKADLGSLKNKSREDIIRELDAAFANSDISWRDIYTDIDKHYFSKDRAITDLKQGIQNVKQAYTDVDASYAADTGNMAADMIIETVLDPGLIAGGIAKGGTKAAVSEAAETAVSKGLQVVFKDGDEIAGFINKPEARAALNAFIGSNEGKNIIFKDAKNFDEDVRLLMDKLSRVDGSFSNPEIRDRFSNMMVHELIESSTHKNSLIMSSIPRARDVIDSKAFKAAYALDRTIDAVDSAIIKSSFFVPWAGVKGAKAGLNVVMDTDTAARVMKKIQLKKNRAAAAVISDKIGNVDLTKTEEVYRLQKQGAINEEAVRFATVALVDEYDSISTKINGLVSEVARGTISDVEALERVGHIISDATGGTYNSVEELAGYIDNLAVKYAGDLQSAYKRVDNTFKRLQDTIDYVAKGQIEEAKKLEQTEIAKSLKAAGTASAESIRRTISFDQFNQLLKDVGFDYEDLEMKIDTTGGVNTAEDRLVGFMISWSFDTKVSYTVQDVLKVVDRCERALHFRTLLRAKVPSAASGLETHKLIGQFNAIRKQLKKIDVINLRDAKVVTLLHTDRVALLEEFKRSPDIQKLYGDFYDEVIAPIADRYRGKTTDEISLMSSALFEDIDTLARQKYGFDRTNQLIEQIKHLPDFTEDQLNSAVSALGSMFNTHNDVGDLMLYPGQVRNKLSVALRTQTGESRVGKKNIADMLQSVDSDTPSPFLKRYFKEFEEKPELKEIYNKYVFQDNLDPAADVERQMLFTALMDPSVVAEWNELAKQGDAFTFHINSTGLNSEINEITSVAFRKWVPLEVTEENPLTLERLLNAFESEETVVLQRGMTDSELENGLSENVLRRLGMKDVTKAGMINQYKKFYGVTDTRPHLTEQELIEQVCDFLRKSSNGPDGQFLPPSLIAHDMDGFNMSYLTNKVNFFRNLSDNKSATAYYADYISNAVSEKAQNTYKRLADKVKETAYTDEQINTLTQFLEDYIDDINYHAHGYRFNDMRTYASVLEDTIKHLKLKKEAHLTTDFEDEFLELWASSNGEVFLDNYVKAVRDITDLTIEPRAWTFISQNDDNLLKAAIDASGRSVVNVDSYIYVDDVLSYFDLDAADGFLVSVEDLKKMHDMAKYIRRVRDKQIVSGAAEFLAPYKADFDRIIESCKELARKNSWNSTQLAYVEHMRVPDNAIDSFLMVKKLYNDHIKYWLDTDETTSLRTSGRDLDTAKYKLLRQGYSMGFNSPRYRYNRQLVTDEAIDFVNNHRRRLFDDLVGGGFGEINDEVFKLMEGAHEPEIYKWSAHSDFEKRILTARDGILRDGLDKATRYTEVNSEIASNLRQLRSMDGYYTAAGFNKKSDTMLALTYTKAKKLFDILDQNGFLKRESFQNFIVKASEAHRLKLQRYRYESLLVDGALNREKLLSELVYNGFNMTVFNSHNYSIKEIDDLRTAVKGWIDNGDDFLSYYEDKSTGNVFIYLNNNCTVAEQGKFRYINETYRFEKPEHAVVPYAEFDELKGLLDLDDIDDFEETYQQLLSCWEDIRLLSFGAVNGTTGRTVSFRQAEDFMASLPSNMNDWKTSEGLLKHELARDVIYDPGFVINDESDMLTDFLGTLHRQADAAKDDCIIINEVFHNNGLQFNDLAQNFTNDELIEYFGNNPDYVVCTIIEDRNTATGLSVRQLNLNNEASVQAAKQMPNTAILPYSVFYEVAENMNRSMDDNVYKRLLGKYMLAYKAFALVKPGTWMRNYFDATLKASIDGGGGASNILSLLNYESKAIADMGTYGRLLADPTLLKEANWDMVQRVFKTDMTYEDFELLKGVVDGGRYKSADKYFIGKAAEKRRDFNIISGKDIGLRNLEEKDIKKAYKQFLSKEADLPLKEKQFMDFYLKKTVPTELENEQFEYMFRKLSNNMRNSNAGNLFDKTIDNMFKPFGYVESMVRYAQTMYLHDMGFSQNQTLRRIHATQFYNAPSWGMWNKLEVIVPFITFKYNNIMFWIRMMDENPRYFRYFEDIYGEIMNTTIEDALDEGQDMDYQYDYGLQSGGIPLGSAQHYFNVGNSFLSAMNDFYGIGHDIDSLNPVLREAVRGSFYALGLNSNKFFSTVDLNPSDEKPEERLLSTLPGYKLGKQAVRLFHNLENISSEEGGPSMEVLYSTLNFLGVLGVRKSYDKSGKFDMEEYQEELARQGMWYDFNQGKVVPISEKNDFGANAPGNSFEDVQAYMLIHHGKIWDANQHKFVPFSEFQAGGYNLGFDFEHDPNAWNALCEYMRKYGKVWDYNQRKFVLTSEYISGGLNDPDLTWDEKIHLMEEKFPNLKWDANQNTFVEFGDYISGGLNDYQNLSSSEFLRSWNELQSLRLALYGETYDKASKSFVKTSEPSIVLTKEFSGNDKREKYDNYFSMLGIPRLGIAEMDLHVSSDGLLMTGDGKYVITGNAEHDKKVFDKFRYTITYGGRGYSNWKNYSYVKNYNKTYNKSNKTYKGRTSGPVYDNPLYQTGVGWNRERGYYRLAYEYSIHYSGPQPGRQVNYLITPPKIYPYGGGYSKFSFQNRY